MNDLIRLATLVTFVFSGQTAAAADLILAQKGKSDYQIVVPESSATPSVAQGLHETARLLQTAFLANGANIPIVTENKRDPKKPTIWLGNTNFAKEQKLELAKLKGWSYVFKVVGNDLIIAGHDQPAPVKVMKPGHIAWDRFGTAKGVVEFVQQYVGTRFVFPIYAPFAD